MTNSAETAATGISGPDLTPVQRARSYFGSRSALIVTALAIVGAGLALNWGWLVAIGAAPVLLAVAPCAAMCALGLCMNKMGGKPCSDTSTGHNAGKPQPQRS